MSERISGCVFCADLDQIVYRTDDLFVLPDLAPLVDGHALICARAHYPSVADLPESSARELDRLCDRVRSLYLREYGAYAMFEHGRTGHCLRRRPEERICHHMHVHVLPLPGDLVTASGLGQRIRSESWLDVLDLGRDTDGYAVVESVDAGRYFFPVTHDLAPHYLRSRAAELLGDPTLADWEAQLDRGTDPERAARNRERLRDLLSEAPLAPAR
ncbi:MAG TPA: hypothetical protein VFT95_05250 [Micromonosporaceae bacterium]|nr:hypothetical protein [Micromonosporaceae bacterium]